MSLHATVIRANGDREELGEIAYWHKNPVRRVIHRALNGSTGKIAK